MKANTISFISGVIFAIGLTISGMINPSKVQGFLDVTGNWDVSLAFVMIGAIGLNFFSFKVITKRKPLCSDTHSIPTNNTIDLRLISGAVMFGAGWGLLGICPGPGIVNLVTLEKSAFIFVGAMTAGMGLFRILEKKKIL